MKHKHISLTSHANLLFFH